MSNLKNRTKTFLKLHLPKKTVTFIKKVRYTRAMKGTNGHGFIEFAVIKNLIGADDCVLDLGANMGFYTKLFSGLVGPHGSVFSFEPVP